VAEVVLTSDLLAFILGEFGSGEQRELIGPLLAGETLGSFALTEPNSGSDAAAMHLDPRKTLPGPPGAGDNPTPLLLRAVRGPADFRQRV
jgi:hypothetical protein